MTSHELIDAPVESTGDERAGTDRPARPSSPAASPILRLSTDLVEQPFRLEFWVDAVSRALFSMTTSSARVSDFDCSLSAASLDALTVVLATGSQQDSFRTRHTLASDADYSFHLLADFQSPCVINWRGSAIRLAPGDLIFTDTRFMHSGHYPDHCRVVNIKMQPAWTSSWLRDPERLAGTRIARETGWGRALSAFVAQLSPELAVAAPLPPKLLADNLGALLALVEAESTGVTPASPSARQMGERVVETIRQRASEPGLTARDVAETLAISERTLHRSLAARGQTFAALLQQCRIETARRMLDASHFMRLTTAEIGRRAGFADASYFVRAATRHLGTTPGRYRSEKRR